MILIIARYWKVGLIAAVLLLAACAGSQQGEGPRIIATTSILADVAASLDVEVATLMPNGVDPHDFEPTARDIAALTSADLILAIGLGLEDSLHDALESARSAGVTVLEIGPLVEPLPMPGGGLDPHVWTDPIRVARAVAAIGESLAAIDSSRTWEEPVNAAVDDLERLDEEIRGSLVGVTQRNLVSDHLVLGYFAARYDFEIIGALVPSTSSLAAPSSRDIADLIALIRENSIPAIFIQPGGPAGLADTVASQVGFPVEVVEVRIESLGPGADSSYRGMMLELARSIGDALG